MVEGLGFRVMGLGLRVEGFRSRGLYQEHQAEHERHLGGRAAGSGRAVAKKTGNIPRKYFWKSRKKCTGKLMSFQSMIPGIECTASRRWRSDGKGFRFRVEEHATEAVVADALRKQKRVAPRRLPFHMETYSIYTTLFLSSTLWSTRVSFPSILRAT